MNESLQPSSQTPALAPVGLPPPCRPPLPCPALRWDSCPSVTPRTPHALPGEGPSPRPSLEHTGLSQFPGPTESTRNLQTSSRERSRRGSRGVGLAAVEEQAWLVYEEDPDTLACTPRLAHGPWRAGSLRTWPNRLGEGTESRGRGGEGQAASPSPVQGPWVSPHAPYILPSSDRMILRRPQGG